MAEEGRELKRPRRAGPGESAPPSTWDFLAPWCDALRGQLVLVDGYIRFISERFGSRSKLSPDQLYPRIREAIELLVLVAHIDKKAWHMLIMEQCKLVGVAPLGYDYEEDEDADYYSGEEVYEDDSEDDQEDEDPDDPAYLFAGPTDPPDPILPRFQFTFWLSPTGGDEFLNKWKWILLTESPYYTPSEAYKQAKKRILEMQSDSFKRRPWVDRVLEIPLSLEIDFMSYRKENLSGLLVEVHDLLELMRRTAVDLRPDIALKAERLEDCATTFVYKPDIISMRLTGVAISDVRASHVLEAAGALGDRECTLYLTVKADNMTEVISALLLVREAGAQLNYLGLTLEDLEDRDASLPSNKQREAFAKLLYEALIRPTPDGASIGSLSINCLKAAWWEVEQVLSAFLTSQLSIGSIQLSEGKDMDTSDEWWFWSMLASTFFHVRSCVCGFCTSQVGGGLHVPDMNLAKKNLFELKNTVRYRADLLVRRGSPGICLVRQGSNLEFTDPFGGLSEEGDEMDWSLQLGDGDPVYLPDDSRAQFLNKFCASDPFSTLLVPAYGPCRVPQESVVLIEDGDIASEPKGKPLTALSLCFRDGISTEVVPIFKGIGWSLQTLSLKVFPNEYGDNNVDDVLPAILTACPQLKGCTLRADFIDLDRLAAELERPRATNADDSSTISSLNLCYLGDFGSGRGVFFAQQLGDPTGRLAQNLTSLYISTNQSTNPFKNEMLCELWTSLRQNTVLENLTLVVSERNFSAIWRWRFYQLNRQVLPPRPLPIASKLAFLSSPWLEERGNGKSSSATRLDQDVISLIFEFAATRVVRSVKVVYHT